MCNYLKCRLLLSRYPNGPNKYRVRNKRVGGKFWPFSIGEKCIFFVGRFQIFFRWKKCILWELFLWNNRRVDMLIRAIRVGTYCYYPWDCGNETSLRVMIGEIVVELTLFSLRTAITDSSTWLNKTSAGSETSHCTPITNWNKKCKY